MNASDRMPVVASDLEGTLTVGASWKGIGRYLKTHGFARTYNAFVALHLPLVLLVKARLIPEQWMRDTWMRNLLRLLKGIPNRRCGRWACGLCKPNSGPTGARPSSPSWSSI